MDSARAKHREARAVLKAAAELANGVRELIHLLVPELSRGTGWLEVIVDTEPDWLALDETRQERIRSLAILAVAISDLAHTPIVDADGALTRAIQAAHAQGQVVAGGLAA